MEPAESLALRSLLERQPVAALSTLHQGEPSGSMVPFALLPRGRGFIIHVSRLASHTSDLLANPTVSLLVMDVLPAGSSALALPRVSIQGQARPLPPEDPLYAEARAAYLAKLPQSAELFTFADFSLFLIAVRTVRHVAGFGRARSLTAEEFAAVFAA